MTQRLLHRSSRPLIALCLLSCAVCWPQLGASPASSTDSLAAIQRGFVSPPMDARPMMRWWWFGPAVKRDELARELRTMKAGGIGGAEIQPVYPLELDDPQTGFRNLPFLSPEFLNMVSFAANTGHELGMRMSLTLGSGWPYGGAWVPVTEASGMLRVVRVPIEDGETSVAVPSIGNGEKLLAAFVARGPSPEDLAEAPPASAISNARLQLPPGTVPGAVAVFFISSRTGQQVKRPAVGADGFVIDHFSAQAVQDHLKNVAEPLVRAFGDHPPYSVFSDSLEAYGADWTPNFLSEFRTRRGYDLTPHLPEMVAGATPEAADLRYDWARTLAELIDQNYLTAINTWAREHHTEFRSQSYGIPAVTLSSNARVDLPEGEGSQWHGPFSFTRWATSASHLYGRPVTSSETWTWLHSPPFRATPLDMKAEADTFFLQGINQLMGHGWPYSPKSAGDPGWNFYAAAVFNNHNPWWIVMPDVTEYLSRMSWLLRQGKPANDVALLLPEEDAQANTRLGQATVSDQMPKLLGPDLEPQILDAGFNFDYIDSEAIDRVGIHYPVLVIPHVQRLPLATCRKIEAFARSGGIVIAIGHPPSAAPGYMEDRRDTSQVKAISRELFAPGAKNTRLVADTTELGTALREVLDPDVKLDPESPTVGFIHRRLEDADLYFIANTDNHPHAFTATFRTKWRHAEWWDAMNGKVTSAGSGPVIRITLAPYESRVVVFSDRPATQNAVAAGTNFAPVDLNHGWKVTLDRTGAVEPMETLHSWTADPASRYYSGSATYVRSVAISRKVAEAGVVMLDFGMGTPVERGTLHFPGSRTWLDAPLRDAALVYVNGKLAGSVWHPPFALNIGPELHAGLNALKIVVANTAINELAGRAAPDYRLLWARYGKRFAPQDEDHLEPLPSGILGPLRLESQADSEREAAEAQ